MDIKELYKLYQQHPCITTDSRNCPEGSIFLALKGESFDGNQFALSALEKGCSYAIVDDPSLNAQHLIHVDDCLKTFKLLAREHRRQFDIPVIGITGTNGKTTTKELVAAVLQQKYNVLYTQGNFNNDVGVPKTLFRLAKEHQIAVIEMGASHPGDIKTLVETAEPTCGLITNVGRAHLQGFGSFEGVVKTKCELYDFLLAREGSTIFVNADNEHLTAALAARHPSPTTHHPSAITQYTTAPNQVDCVSGEVVDCAPFLRFRWREPLRQLEQEGRPSEWHEIQTHLIGAYNIDNLLAAITVGLHFGVDSDLICKALEGYVPSNNRSQMTVTEKNHLIVDAYNANPSSMQAALSNFKLMAVSNKMAIIGQMGELGAESAAEHRHLVDMLKTTDAAEVWLVGDNFADIPLPETDRQHFRLFHDVEEVKAAIHESQPQGRYILIKGSNAVKLFQLPELL